MSEVEAQIENVSFMLNGIREEYNHDLLSVCLQELENVKRKVHKQNDPSYESEENKLLRYFEAKYNEATGIIGRLEDEIDELKDKEKHNSFENGNILSEKSIFWKNSENLPPGKHGYGSHDDSFSLNAMKKALSELEQKNARTEKESEEDKALIKQLETINAQTTEKLAFFSKQIEELNETLEECEMKFSQAVNERNKLSKEVAHVRSEADIYKRRVEDLETEIDMKDATIESFEGKIKRMEEKSRSMFDNINELVNENEVLRSEKMELAEKLHKAQQDLKEKFQQAKKMNSEEKKVTISVNNYYVNSPQAFTTAPVNPVNVNTKEFSTPKNKSRYAPALSEDHPSAKQNTQMSQNLRSMDSIAFSKLRTEERRNNHDLDELNPLSSYMEVDENEFANDSISEFCRETLSGKKETGLKSIEEEEIMAASQVEAQATDRVPLTERGPISERKLSNPRTLSKSIEKQAKEREFRRRNFACLSCQIF